MKKDEAIKEARIGALMQGGTFYVVRRGNKYKAIPAYLFEARRHGRVAEMFDADKVRRTTPPTTEVVQ